MSNPPLAYTATPHVQAIALKITRDLPPPGQPLTGNRTLAARYNVGPDSVRDAKAVLAGLGILTRKGFIYFVTEAKDAPTQPDDEHEHVPRRDSWVITRSFLPADLMEPEHYPVTAACQECHLPPSTGTTSPHPGCSGTRTQPSTGNTAAVSASRNR